MPGSALFHRMLNPCASAEVGSTPACTVAGQNIQIQSRTFDTCTSANSTLM